MACDLLLKIDDDMFEDAARRSRATGRSVEELVREQLMHVIGRPYVQPKGLDLMSEGRPHLILDLTTQGS